MLNLAKPLRLCELQIAQQNARCELPLPLAMLCGSFFYPLTYSILRVRQQSFEVELLWIRPRNRHRSMISYSFSHVLMDTPTPALSPAGAGTTIGAGSIAGIGSFES